MIASDESIDRESRAHLLPAPSATFMSPNNANFNAPLYDVFIKNINDIKELIKNTPLNNHQIAMCFTQYDYVTLTFIEAIREGVMNGK